MCGTRRTRVSWSPAPPASRSTTRCGPAAGETVLQKANPNSFLQTPLEEHLRGAGVERLVVCGMMTAMCVDATVRAAVDLGFETHPGT